MSAISISIAKILKTWISVFTFSAASSEDGCIELWPVYGQENIIQPHLMLAC